MPDSASPLTFPFGSMGVGTVFDDDQVKFFKVGLQLFLAGGWQNVIVFSIVIAVLVFKPSGLFAPAGERP